MSATREQGPAPWPDVRASLARVGLNAVGVADGSPYQAELPGCRAVVVFGSGGPALWDAFVAAIEADPATLCAEQHPLDRFIARAIAATDPTPGPTRRWVRCAFDAETFVDFRPLSLAAGLGWPSRLGLLLHPEHGPWLGLRAACFTTEPLPLDTPLDGDGPCADCPAPCEAACPVGAVSAARFDIGRCAAHRTPPHQGGPGGCPEACASRNICPVGINSRYSALEQYYHDNRLDGRRALARSLGVTDAVAGEGPYWVNWAGRSPQT